MSSTISSFHVLAGCGPHNPDEETKFPRLDIHKPRLSWDTTSRNKIRKTKQNTFGYIFGLRFFVSAHCVIGATIMVITRHYSRCHLKTHVIIRPDFIGDSARHHLIQTGIWQRSGNQNVISFWSRVRYNHVEFVSNVVSAYVHPKIRK